MASKSSLVECKLGSNFGENWWSKAAFDYVGGRTTRVHGLYNYISSINMMFLVNMYIDMAIWTLGRE